MGLKTKLYVRGLPDITVGPWQMEDSSDTLHSDEYMVAAVEGAYAEQIPAQATDLHKI